MTFQLPLNNGSLVLLAINGSLVSNIPAESINTEKIISVQTGVLSIDNTNTPTLRVIYWGSNATPDTYDFEARFTDTAATAGFTAAVSATAGDKVIVTVDGVAYNYICAGGETPAAIRTAVTALLNANTQGFTQTSTLVGRAILYTLHGPAGSTSYWNGKVVNVSFGPNTGPTFSVAVNTNFTGGEGAAEQMQAFLTDQTISSPLVPFTGVLVNGDNKVSKGPSIMLNQLWVVSKTYDGTSTTKIIYDSPLLLPTSYVVSGSQIA